MNMCSSHCCKSLLGCGVVIFTLIMSVLLVAGTSGSVESRVMSQDEKFELPRTANEVAEIVAGRFAREGYREEDAMSLAHHALQRAVGLDPRKPEIDRDHLPDEPIFSPMSNAHAILVIELRKLGIENAGPRGMPDTGRLATEAMITYSKDSGGTRYLAVGDTDCAVYTGDIYYCENGLKKRKMVQYIGQDMWDQFNNACPIVVPKCRFDEDPFTFLTLAQACLGISSGTTLQLVVQDDDVTWVPCDEEEDYIVNYDCIDGANKPGDFDCEEISIECCPRQTGCECE